MALSYEYSQIPWVNSNPENYELSNYAEPVYDPKLHLDLQLPEYLINLKFERLDLLGFDLNSNEDSLKIKQFLLPGLAYTAPFKVLSKEGLKVLREIIDYHKENTSQLSNHTNRQAWAMRGLGYVSKFIQDFNKCPLVSNLMSIFAAKTVVAHGMPMNYSHINIGVPGVAKKVDQWHLDSVGYVLVILISDADGMVGGELQVLNRDRDEKALEVLNSATPGYTPDEIQTVNYSSSGNGIFMQGSHIFHQVTAVTQGPRARISLVNSFMPSNVFDEDTTKYSTFRDGDPKHVSYLECARLIAHRASGMLDYLINKIPFDEPGKDLNQKEAMNIMHQAIGVLQNGYLLLKNEKDDHIGFFDETEKRINLIKT